MFSSSYHNYTRISKKHLPMRPVKCDITCIYKKDDVCDCVRINKSNSDSSCYKMNNKTLLARLELLNV